MIFFKGIGLDTLSQMYHIFSETCMVIIYDRFVLYELGKKLMSRNLDGNFVWFSSYSIFCSHCEQLFVCMLYARLVSLLNGLIPKGRQAEDERAVIRQLRKMRVKFSLHGPRLSHISFEIESRVMLVSRLMLLFIRVWLFFDLSLSFRRGPERI